MTGGTLDWIARMFSHELHESSWVLTNYSCACWQIYFKSALALNDSFPVVIPNSDTTKVKAETYTRLAKDTSGGPNIWEAVVTPGLLWPQRLLNKK
jgi:hypothetical protein